MNRKNLWVAVDKILWNDWDPIGINGSGAPSDEYQGYVSSIVNLLLENRDLKKIAKMLCHHANDNMGLTTVLDDHLVTAEKLLELNRKN